MKVFQALKDARCRRFLRSKGIKFSPSLQALGARAELVLEGALFCAMSRWVSRILKWGL